jgi:hypothetical protein
LRVGICIEDSAQIANHDPNITRLKAAWNFTNETLRDGDQLGIYRIQRNVDNIYQTEYPLEGPFEDYPFENMTKYLENNSTAYFDNAGGQRLEDCIDMATDDLDEAWDESGVYPALILVTSAKQFIGSTIEDMMDYSRQRGIPLFVVGVGDAKEDLMYDLAMVSNGGRYFYASTGDALQDIFDVIGEIISSGSSRSMDDGTTSSRYMDEPGSRTAPPGGNRLKLYNPVGTDVWAQKINRNVTFWCANQLGNSCDNARIYFDPGSGMFTQITSINLTKSPYDWTSDSASFQPADRCWQYNWTVPNVECLACRIKVEVDSGGNTYSATSGNFEIFDSGLPLGGAAEFNVSAATTEEFNLGNYETAKLSFWHKYDLLTAENGGVILVGNSSLKDSGYKYHYVIPSKSYPGNLRMDKNILDDDGTRILFAYNGRSADQTFDWEYDEVDLTPFIDPANPWIRIKFIQYNWGYGNGGGWWLDDVKVAASRADTDPVSGSMADLWDLYEWDTTQSAFLQPHSGNFMWWCHKTDKSHDVASGIDNSLYTKSIDLTNAKDAHLSAYFKFNFDDDAGRPPDGFRVEISSDNGVTWRPINLGVRSSWGVSGNWVVDGKSPDGKKAYTGIQEGGANSNTPVWIEGETLWRLQTDISGWTGSVIKLRFRVVTNLDANHYEAATTFRGLAIDDVLVRGNTTILGSPLTDVQQQEGFTPPPAVDDTAPFKEKSAMLRSDVLAVPSRIEAIDIRTG